VEAADVSCFGMMKWLVILLLVVLTGGSWYMYAKQRDELSDLETKITQVQESGDVDSELEKLEGTRSGLEGQKLFTGILLTFMGAGLAGIFFVVYLLPFFAQRVTHAVYDSAEMVERDVMYSARSLIAQGDYQGAIEAFKEAAAADPLNRLPWVEMAKIYKDNLGDPASAIQTIRYALESQEWEINDAAYFLFRLAELYDEVEGNRASAVAIMNQVIEQFPETRHSANAAHKLHEWEAQGQTTPAAEQAEQALTEEEIEYFAKLERQAKQGSGE
jgi:tetratricopeptide (TPR) repeat protein